MKCWIIYNAFLESKKFIDFAHMLQQAAEVLGHEAHIIKNSDILNRIESVPSISGFTDKLDYVLFTDKDIYLARFLERQGIPVYNSADAIEISDDKIKTYQLLAQAGIPIPKTIVLPKTFGLTANLGKHFFDQAIQKLGLPLVVKEAFGSFGEQVHLANDRKELLALVHLHGHQPLMLQEFIHTSYGRDLRIQVVGNLAIAAMERKSDNDFRSNVTTGGRIAAYKLLQEEVDIAVQASQTIGAKFSGVDILFGPEDTRVICEVNTNAHIRNLLNCTGVNAAVPIIQYIEHQLKARYQS